MSRRLVIPGRAEADREIEVTHRWWQFSARFNVRQGHNVPAARMHDGESEGVMLRWGIPPRKEGGVTLLGASLISTEELASGERRAAWRAGQRCIVPLAGFYVWQLNPTGVTQPHYVRVVNRTVFGVAALWERTVSDDDEDDVMDSCALIMVPTNILLSEIDSSGAGQMPAILERGHYPVWLAGTAGEAQALLTPYPHERMVAHAVPPYVNYPEYEGPPLIHAIR